MGRKRTYISQFFILTVTCVVFESCENEKDLINYFNSQEYEKVEAYLASADQSWKQMIYSNKLSIETSTKKRFNLDTIYKCMSKDSSWKLTDYQMIYYQFRYRPDEFIIDLMKLENKFYNPYKSEFYYSELLGFLSSRNSEYRNFSFQLLKTDYNYRYQAYFFQQFKQIRTDESFSNLYKNELEKIAIILDKQDKSSGLYSENLSNFTHTSLQYRDGKFHRFSEPDSLLGFDDLTSLDIRIMENDLVLNLLDSFLINKKRFYRFFNSDKKLFLKSQNFVHKLVQDQNIPDFYKLIAIKQMEFPSADSLYHHLTNDSLSYSIKSVLLDKINPRLTSDTLLQTYFMAFKNPKMQDELEKRIKNFDRNYIYKFMKNKLKSEQERDIKYSLFFIGKIGLSELRELVEPFLKHTNSEIVFLAEQTLTRLGN